MNRLYVLNVLSLVICTLAPQQGRGELPMPTYENCGLNESLAECPPDVVRADGSWKGSTWEFASFIPPEIQSQVRREEIDLGTGNGVDVAWRYGTGRFDITIAVLDSGIEWQNTHVVNKILLNQGELPAPQRADGSVCTNYDCDGNGLFNIQDYVNDARVSITQGDDPADGLLDGSDLIYAFSDGVDDDGNGYIDDIAGWDFLWDDNNPFTNVGFDHGTGVMEQAAAEGGQADTDIGVCPNCSIMPIRSGDSFMAESNRLAQGILYAVDNGAEVIAMASGTINNTKNLHDAIEYAWRKGVTVISAIGDELSYHHLYPGSSDYLMAVHSIVFWPPDNWENAKSFLGYNGCNNYGSHLTVVAATKACATGSTAIISGAAGLLHSLARDKGFEIHPDEVRALLNNTATDINVKGSGGERGPYFPSRDGWDLMFGYGRVNVGKAMENLNNNIIPPQAHLTQPAWFTYIDALTTPVIDVQAAMDIPHAQSYDWVLQWAPGGEPTDQEFAGLSAGNKLDSFEGSIFQWNIADIPRRSLDPAAPVEQVTTDQGVEDKFRTVNVHTITLRLIVTDERNRSSEMRKSFFLKEEPDLVPGFPKNLKSSGEASPYLIDMDNDGVLDVIIGSANGGIYIYNGQGESLPGWPVLMPVIQSQSNTSTNNHLEAAAYASGDITPYSQPVLGGVVAADLDGDGDPEVAAATMGGLLFVYDHLGQLLPGFPVSRDPIGEADTNEFQWYDEGIMATPLIVDLDNDGNKEIVVAAMDQKVYAWRFDGTVQPGWPVILQSENTDKHVRGRTVSSPIAADMNGDNQIDIVVGTNEWDPELYIPGYAYAISGAGNNEVGGPVLPGWPITVPAALNGLVPWIGEGVPGTPAVADVDNDGFPEVALSGVVSCPHLYQHDGKRGAQYHCSSTEWIDAPTQELAGVAFVSNVAFADVDQDGDYEAIAPLSGADYGISLGLSTWMEYQDHLIGMWDAATGDPVPGWPVVIEDVGFFMRPAVADVDGDGSMEVLASSGGQTVHAYNLDGFDVEGWPKFTGGWIVSALATGDITGDGMTEIIGMSREGYLFAWTTDGQKIAEMPGVPWTLKGTE